jgi:hypothetical protein
MRDPIRATGRTYRQVLRALLGASAGEQVLVILPTSTRVREFMGVVQHLSSLHAIRQSKTSPVVQFASGGSVRATTPGENFAGLRYHVVEVDDDCTMRYSEYVRLLQQIGRLTGEHDAKH